MENIKDNRPLISVIIITYNQEMYIEQAAKSVLMQEGDFDLELIIGEDCSTDATRAICQQLQAQYPDKVRLLLQSTNQGLLKNYLSTLQLAKGSYIAQLAGDDYWTDTQKLAKQLAVFQQDPQIGLVYTDADFLMEDGRTKPNIFKNKHVVRYDNFIDHLENGGFIAPSTWMYKSEFNPASMQYDQHQYVDESYVFVLDMYQISKIHFLNESTTVYRVLGNSASKPQDIKKRFKYYKGLFAIQKQYLDKYHIAAEHTNRILNRQYLNLVHMAVDAEDEDFLQEAIAYFNERNIKFEQTIQKLKTFRIWNNKLEKAKRTFPINYLLRLFAVK